MENAEVDIALEELEARLERLRALYEQYFMGIERIEPSIPRKDVDRRIYVLRREKIRNTAKRFKLQTIISRYNTFQQYWQRICREIEQGTYKRHVIKAERIAPGKFLTHAARKRLGRAALEAAAEGVEPQPEAAPSVLPPEPTAPLAAAPSGVPVAGGRLAPPPKPPRGAPGTVAPPPAAAAPSKPSRAPFESMDLDMDFLGDWDPAAATSSAKPGLAAQRVPEVPARPFGKPLSRPINAGPPPKPAAPVASRAPSAPPPKPVSVPPRPAAPPRAPLASVLGAMPPPRAPMPSVLGAAPPPPRVPLSSVAARPAPPPAAAKALAPIVPPVKPAASRPAAPASPAATSDERVRELHARLVEAKRQTQDTAAVSMEGLARSMKATEAKLREQHKNRKIDFDVVIKDGKAVLKPIVR